MKRSMGRRIACICVVLTLLCIGQAALAAQDDQAVMEAMQGKATEGQVNAPQSPVEVEDGRLPVPTALPVVPGEAVESGDFVYAMLDDGTAKIVRYKGAETQVAIPARIDNVAVSALGPGAFYNCGLTDVEIPTGIKTIEYAAFEGNPIREAYIPAGVTLMTGNPFEGCRNLERVTVDDGNEHFRDADGVLLSKDGTVIVCYPAGRAGSYALPDGVTTVGSGAFSMVGAMQVGGVEIYIPAGADTFPQAGILGSSDGDEPKAVLYVQPGSEAEAYAQEMEYEYVLFDPQTQSLPQPPVHDDDAEPVDGYYYELLDDGTLRITGFAGCVDEWLEMPTEIEGKQISTIGAGAFYGVAAGEIIIPEGVSVIEEGAFEKSAIETANIPASVRRIAGNPFRYCPFLSKITVDAGNPYYASEEGVLYDAERTTLLAYPGGQSKIGYVPYKRVTAIGEDAFTWSGNAGGGLYLTLPQTIEQLPEGGMILSSKVKLYVEEGSVAEAYAIEKGYAYVISEFDCTIHFGGTEET